jgi:hypothetical protein
MIDTSRDVAVVPDGGRNSETSTTGAESVDFGRPDTVGLGSDWTLVEQRHYDPNEERSLTVRVIETIGAALNHDARVGDPLEPLYYSIDVEAVERTLFGPLPGRPRREVSRRDSTVTFEYEGRQVTVREDGWIFVYAANQA